MMVSNELEKLMLYVGEKKRITLGDVETMVLAAKQRSLYELDRCHLRQGPHQSIARARRSFVHWRRRRGSIGHIICWPRPSARCWSFWNATFAINACYGRRCGRLPGPTVCRRRHHPNKPAANKSKRELTRAIRLTAKADLALRSNPVSRRMVMESLSGFVRRSAARNWLAAGRTARVVAGAIAREVFKQGLEKFREVLGSIEAETTGSPSREPPAGSYNVRPYSCAAHPSGSPCPARKQSRGTAVRRPSCRQRQHFAHLTQGAAHAGSVVAVHFGLLSGLTDALQR